MRQRNHCSECWKQDRTDFVEEVRGGEYYICDRSCSSEADCENVTGKRETGLPRLSFYLSGESWTKDLNRDQRRRQGQRMERWISWQSIFFFRLISFAVCISGILTSLESLDSSVTDPVLFKRAYFHASATYSLRTHVSVESVALLSRSLQHLVKTAHLCCQHPSIHLGQPLRHVP